MAKSDEPALVAVIVILVACMIFCVFGLFMSIKTSTEFSDHCDDLGGRVVWTKGSDLCVSNDGRILDDG